MVAITLSTGLRHRGGSYAWAVAGVAAATGVLAPLREYVNETTVALVLLLIVLFVAAWRGSGPALSAAVLGVLCFNFFFLPPTGTLTIADPRNWVALAAFMITAVTAGQLSARARRRAEEAEAGRREIKRLYEELREAFARASHAEALRQSEQLKSALLDAVTHDLRTPLTSIKASASALLEDAGRGTSETLPLDAEGRQELLAVIDEEADRLNRFVEGLVEMARIEAGEMHLRRAWGGVDEIIAAALARAEPLTAQHHIEVAIEDELPSVRVDARAVAEVIYTLIDNATKFAPVGTTVRITAARAPGEMIQIAVEDEGAGVPIEMRESIFQKFSRAEDQRGVQNRPAGLGMGLAIARGIVEAHGGRIHVEDARVGCGARFVFTAPVGDEEPEPVNGKS